MTISGVMSMAVMAINAQATAIGNISDNVANAGTPGYKAVNTLFHDLVLGQRNGGSPVLDSRRPGGVIAYADFANRKAGQIVSDIDSPTSAAISGNGFFPVAKPTGFDAAGQPTGFETEVHYTRQGDFHLDSSGRLVNGAGYYLMTASPSGTGAPQVLTVNTGNNAAGSGFAGVSIGDGGLVSITYDDKSTVDIGQILLANFREPDELDRVDGTAFRVTAGSGDAVYGNPNGGSNTAGIGTIKGSALEQSTVDTADQMTQLIIAQQAYSMNSQVLTAANEMMTTAVNLKG